MIQAMREKTQGIIATIIIVLVGITFAFWGIGNYLKSHGDLDTIAKVNKVKITQEQVRDNYERAKQRLMLSMGKNYSYDQKFQEQLKNDIIQQMIKSEAVFQALITKGFYISPLQINAMLQQLPALQENGHFSSDRLKILLNNMMFSQKDFFNELQRSAMTAQVHNGIVMSYFVLPNEANDLIKIVNQTRDIKYTIITAAGLKKNIKINDKDIQNYYEQNQEQFKTPEQISIEYVELTADALKDKVKIAPQEIQQYYNDHIDAYSTPQRWQVERIFVETPTNADSKTSEKAAAQIKALAEKAKTGVSFEQLDPIHGKATWITKNQVPQDIANVITSLKIGEISAPFKTPTGFFVIRTLKIEEAKVQPFNSVREQVTKAVTQEKLVQLFSEQTDKLSDLTYTNSDTLQPAAIQLGLPIKTTELFTEQGTKTGLLANLKVVKAAFSDQVLKQNYNSDLIEIEPGHSVIIRIKEHKAATVKPIDEARPQIIQQLTITEAQQSASTLGKQLVEAIKANQSSDKIISQHGLVWKTLNKAKRQLVSSVDPSIIQAAFNIPAPDGHPATVGVVLQNGDFAIVQVNKVYAGDAKTLTLKQLKEFKHNMATTLGEIDYNLYVDNLIKQAKIKRYDQKK